MQHSKYIRSLGLVFALLVIFRAEDAHSRIIDANANGNWSDPATWLGGAIPDQNDTVRINTTVTVDAIGVCKRLIIGMAGGRYSSDGTVIVANSLAILSTGDIVLGDPPSGFFSGFLTTSGGAVLIGGNVTFNAGAISATGGTITYNGGSQSIVSGTYYNLKLDGGTKTALGNIIVKGDITIDANTTVRMGNFTHSIYGNWVNKGTVDGGTSTVNMVGTTTQNIDGTAAFNNLYLTNGPKVAQGPLAVIGNFTIASSASFDAGSYSHIIDGNWIRVGTFIQGTSLINLAGDSDQIISGTTTFHGLNMYNSGLKTANSDVTVESYFHLLPNTTFDAGAHLHTFQGITQIDGVLKGEKATCVLNGPSFQLVTGSGSPTFGTFRINNGSGVRISLPSMFIDSALGLVAGDLSIGNTMVYLNTGAAINGASPNSFLITDSSGLLVREVLAGSTVQFPIGTAAGSYNPVSVGLPASDPTETFAARVVPLTSSTFGVGSLDTTRSVKRAWFVQESIPGSNHADLTFRWNSDQDGSNIGVSPNQPILLKAFLYDAGAKSYQPITDVTGSAGPSDPLVASTSGHPLITFGFTPYVVGAPTPLPITLVAFTGEIVPGIGVKLRWSTASEISNYGFYVQRKGNLDSTWSELAGSFTPGNGTTTVPHDYSFTDTSVLAGEWMYRLHQVDSNGSSHYSDEITVSLATGVAETKTPRGFLLEQNYPNPFNPTTGIRFQVTGNSWVRLVVYDVLGREVKVLVNGRVSSGSHEAHFNGSRLASGVYLYRLTAGSFSAVRKMILAR